MAIASLHQDGIVGYHEPTIEIEIVYVHSDPAPRSAEAVCGTKL